MKNQKLKLGLDFVQGLPPSISEKLSGEYVLPPHITSTEEVHEWIMSLSTDSLLEEITELSVEGEVPIPNEILEKSDEELHQFLMGIFNFIKNFNVK